jgi:hypothetical protein
MQSKVVVAILNPGESPADNGRTIHALKLAKGLKDAGAELVVVFEGKGVTWLPRFLNQGEDSHPFVKHYGGIFDEIRPFVRACNMCCKRFNVLEQVQESDIPVDGEGSEHIDIAHYVLNGYQVINH